MRRAEELIRDAVVLLQDRGFVPTVSMAASMYGCGGSITAAATPFTFLPAPAISVPGSIRVRFCAASFAAMGARHEPAPAEFPPADEEAY